MSWICEYCSTANADSDTRCFVCEVARSEESIREAKRIAREARSRRVNAWVYKSATLTGKIMCVSSISVFSLIALLILYFKMRSGELSDLVYVGIAMAENTVVNFRVLFGEALRGIVACLADVPIEDLAENLKTIFGYTGDVLESGREGIVSELFVNCGAKCQSFLRTLSVLSDKVEKIFCLSKNVIFSLADKASKSIDSVLNNAEEIVQKARETFLQFKE